MVIVTREGYVPFTITCSAQGLCYQCCSVIPLRVQPLEVLEAVVVDVEVCQVVAHAAVAGMQDAAQVRPRHERLVVAPEIRRPRHLDVREHVLRKSKQG